MDGHAHMWHTSTDPIHPLSTTNSIQTDTLKKHRNCVSIFVKQTINMVYSLYKQGWNRRVANFNWKQCNGCYLFVIFFVCVCERLKLYTIRMLSIKVSDAIFLAKMLQGKFWLKKTNGSAWAFSENKTIGLLFTVFLLNLISFEYPPFIYC